MENDKDIINYEVMGGWPVYKRTFKELLLQLGAIQENGLIGFIETDPMLDSYPITVEDDGMGYGANEMYFTEALSGISHEKPYITIFRERKMPNALLWLKSPKDFHYEALISYKGINAMLSEIREGEDELEYKLTLCDKHWRGQEDTDWIPLSELAQNSIIKE